MLLLYIWRKAKLLTWDMIIRMGPSMPVNIFYLVERPIIDHVPPEGWERRSKCAKASVSDTSSARFIHIIDFRVGIARYHPEQTPQLLSWRYSSTRHLSLHLQEKTASLFNPRNGISPNYKLATFGVLYCWQNKSLRRPFSLFILQTAGVRARSFGIFL